jgi:hypothetical protein
MAKVGLSLKIDVTKIDKARLFKGQKGTYLDATIFVDLDQQDEYGNNGMITQSWKDQQKGEGAILGNGAIFWRDQSAPAQQPANNGGGNGGPNFDVDDEIPFAPIGLQYRGILNAM